MGSCKIEEEEEEYDISDSEMKEYKELTYKSLKFRTHKIRAPNGKFMCPFCGHKKQVFSYTLLLQHAIRVSEGSEDTAKQRASHFALATYLVTDLADEADPPPQTSTDSGDGFKNAMYSVQECYQTLLLKLKEKEDELQEKEKLLSCLILRECKSNGDLQEARKALLQKELTNKEMAEKLRQVEENYGGVVQRLKEKESALPHSVLKELKSNEELQQVSLELVKLISDIPSDRRVDFGVKRKGRIYEKALRDACNKRFPPSKAKIKAAELRLFWRQKLRENPRWQPFQIIEDDKGNPQGFMKTNDEQLQGLEEEFGPQICSVVCTSLIDLHGSNGSNKDPEVWNLRENRKASLTEVISCISTHLKTLDQESNTRKRLRRFRFMVKQEFPLPHSC